MRDFEGEFVCDGMRINGSCFGVIEWVYWENLLLCGS